MKNDQETSEERLRIQIEELRKENTRLELASQRPDGADAEVPSQDYVFELEIEIADLREKIVENEEHSRRQKEEIAMVFTENEEVKQDLRERELELRDLEAQLSETKSASTNKIKQKDETIAFMQTEMMRLMQEKQKCDTLLREKKLDAAEIGIMSSHHKKGVDEEAEKAKLQAINEQLRLLDEENRTLEEKLNEAQYNHSMRLKEKQGIILDLQEELNDAKWELGARKEGADYITLLKDGKERKKDLDKTRKELKKAEERISDLEREKADLCSNKQDLEKEVESLNKSVVCMDSGEYVSGLKRQLKSLKQHNMALERKAELERRDANEKLRIQDAKIRILEHDLEKLKNPTRAAIKSVFYGFGRKDTEFDSDGVMYNGRNGTEEDNGMEQGNSISEGGDDGQPPNPTEAEPRTLSTRDVEDAKYESETEAKGGSIWTLFSPRRSTHRNARNSSRLILESNSSMISSEQNVSKDIVNEETSDDVNAFEESHEVSHQVIAKSAMEEGSTLAEHDQAPILS
jgi:chromosome segregation ATPase